MVMPWVYIVILRLHHNIFIANNIDQPHFRPRNIYIFCKPQRPELNHYTYLQYIDVQCT